LSVLLRRLIGANVTLDVPQVRELWPVKADVAQFEQVRSPGGTGPDLFSAHARFRSDAPCTRER
jgi:hypothetical protein